MTEPLVGIVMGSDSDWEVMKQAAAELTRFEVPHERRVVSAHRTPDLLYQYAESAAQRPSGTPSTYSIAIHGSIARPSAVSPVSTTRAMPG